MANLCKVKLKISPVQYRTWVGDSYIVTDSSSWAGPAYELKHFRVESLKIERPLHPQLFLIKCEQGGRLQLRTDVLSHCTNTI